MKEKLNSDIEQKKIKIKRLKDTIKSNVTDAEKKQLEYQLLAAKVVVGWLTILSQDEVFLVHLQNICNKHNRVFEDNLYEALLTYDEEE